VEPRWVSKIPMGSAIMRLPTRYYQSFLINFPEQPLKNTPTTDDLVLQRYVQWVQALITNRAQDHELAQELHKLNDLARRTIGSHVPLDVVLALDAITTTPRPSMSGAAVSAERARPDNHVLDG